MKRIFHLPQATLRLLLASIALLASLGATQADDLDVELDREQGSQTATAITIIFDNSGSMADGGKMPQAKRAFGAWLAAQEDNTRFGLIQFDRQGTVEIPISENTRDTVATAVASLRPRGKTPICNCLKLAGKEINRRREEYSPYERHVVVLFTDGQETVDYRRDAGVVTEIRNLRQQLIEVVGIGFHGEGDYMNGYATSYYRAGDEESLKQGLSKVAAEIDASAEVEISPQISKLMAETASAPQVAAVSNNTARLPDLDGNFSGNQGVFSGASKSTGPFGFSFRSLFLIFFAFMLIRGFMKNLTGKRSRRRR